ncbi:hypothetical protein FisN_5Lh158 [Fistulifera solaris]|uniref:Uncharacterized protein n=1 Tax=Fistulifera solaris TaxID=1519565 RepID=A0A1Z5JJG9_FISSO|nr:hypothetical protein FisN_5Lh158 [Fistulifera solaris]|eukprot:GAX13938.1 hypothetical protein FisN_5Lh158 [Fistulifera solaris]
MITTHPNNNPIKLLHYLAPKIPAIRHSPDIALQIRASRTDMDCGLAACVIATLGRICELQEEFADDILKDRRFEQLVECVMCGVDHKDTYTEGLSIRDACRAAWGIAVLSSHRKSSDNKPGSVLEALAARVAHVLEHRQELLKRGDMVQDGVETVEKGIELFAEELAEDAVSVLWTFACVEACTGQNVSSLVNLCILLLIQDPFMTRKLAQEASLSDVEMDTNIELGTNDVVERLAQSELETESTSSDVEIPSADHVFIEAKDSSISVAETLETSAARKKMCLLDWLSPHELIDSLWAIALIREKLDNTSSATDEYCKKALQRMADVLQIELRRIKHHYETDETVSRDYFHDDISILDQEVKVSGDLDSLGHAVLDDNTGVEEWSETSRSRQSSKRKVNQDINGECDIKAETDAPGDFSDMADEIELLGGEEIRNEGVEADSLEVLDDLLERHIFPLIVTDAIDLVNTEKPLEDDGIAVIARQADECGLEGVGGESEQVFLETSDDADIDLPFSCFSSRDLCSLAWAVTELDGSHREAVVHDIAHMLNLLGVGSMRGLSGSDLTNLCWAVAKSNFAIQVDVSNVVVKWVADRAVEITSRDKFSDDSPSLLLQFSPHELGRLVWSLSTILLDQGTVRWTSVSIVSLIYRALLVTGSHLALFRSEDMARVVWAFLSLTDTSVSFGWPGVPDALGKLLATIETSLLDWESMRETSFDNTEMHDHPESPKVTAFLRTSKFALRFFDQRLEHAIDDSNDIPGLAKQSNRLPLLRHVPVDPLSLCKLASAVCKLAHQFDKTIIQSGVLTRILLRLFLSHDGRLLHECPLPDLVRLTETAALSMEVPAARTLTSHFARKVLQFVNEMPSDESGFIWLDMELDDLSELIWSLGQLGATFCEVDPDRPTAHRRLRLAVKPSFEVHSMESLSVSKTIQLLNGLVSTQLALQMTDRVVQILLYLEDKLPMTEEELDLCGLLTALASLRRDVIEKDLQGQKNFSEQSVDVSTGALGLDHDPEKSMPSQPVSTDLLLDLCDRVRVSLTASTFNRFRRTTTRDLITILSVMVRDRLKCDEMVRTIHDCIQDRARAIDAQRKATSTLNAASRALRAFTMSMTDEAPSLRVDSLESTAAALDELMDAHCTDSRVSKDSYTNAMELELSKLRELVEQYNRLDLKSGHSKQESGRKMTKHSFSRLFPVLSQTLS